ncbi:uncharacterized protein LOC116842364 isoform X2 [Odontomachus brunneus]|nr:uncharacterized protein LOC116842364 isoform X2 [Odontomachus brunneus]
MRPTVSPDESATSNRSTHTASCDDYPSRGRKEQISGLGNAQTKYETHLLQHVAHPSTYGPLRPLDWHIANREWCVYTVVEDRRDVPESPVKASQEHRGVDPRDVDLPRRHQSMNTDEEWYVKPHLWCVRCHRRKKQKCRELELGKSTRRLLERMKKYGKESEKSDDEAVAGVSTAPHRESISRAPEKSERSRKQGAPEEVADKDVTGKGRKERKVRGDERQERGHRERKMKERRERREREERIPHPVADAQPAAPPADFLKSCCYLCAQNTLAIAAAAGPKPQQSDKYVQVSVHQFHAATPALDKSCSATLLVRSVQSSVKVKTREIGTLCPGTKAKRKKLSVLPRLTWTKCPARRHVACETDKSARRDNAEKRAWNEKCCGAERKNT